MSWRVIEVNGIKGVYYDMEMWRNEVEKYGVIETKIIENGGEITAEQANRRREEYLRKVITSSCENLKKSGIRYVVLMTYAQMTEYKPKTFIPVNTMEGLALYKRKPKFLKN